MYAIMAAFRIHGNHLNKYPTTTIEVFFLIDLIIQFMLSYQDIGKDHPVKDLNKIARRYLKTEFAWDMVPLLPFHLIPLSDDKNTLFYLLKVIRLYKGFKILDVSMLISSIKARYKQKLEDEIASEPPKDPSSSEINFRSNKIEEIIFISHSLKTIKLIIHVSNVSFLLGMFFYTLAHFNHLNPKE